MLKNLFRLGITCSVAVVALTSCENQDFTSYNVDVKRIDVMTISPEMAKVRDYVPKYAVMAHRGSTFWAPEETESAWRWAREMGVDYLESDLQCTKDGVILANHDDNLKRTTNIENVYGELVPEGRKDFYMRHGMTEAQAEELVKKDKASFRPYYAMSYMYEELLALDAGTWFNESSLEQARPAFSEQKQYISTLEDQIRYAEGKMLKRDSNGERVWKVEGTWDPNNARDCLTYTFEYVDDPQDTGNRPGVYIEFKESWLNPSDFEKRVYEELDRLGWNIITKPCNGVPSYKDGKVNVGNSNGSKVTTYNLNTIPEIDLSEVTSINNYAFNSGIKVLPYLNCKNATDVSINCANSYKLTGLDMDSATGSNTIADGNSSIRYIMLYNMGKAEGLSKVSIYSINIGKEDESIPESAGARQALIDSLITNSFDRATASYSACTISLNKETKALLTEEEIAQITAKGFTIL